MKAPPDVLALGEQLCFPLYAASNLIQRLYRPLLKPLGLTYAQYIVMLALWERDGLTVRDLETRLLLDSGTISPLLRRLEKTGLVIRSQSEHDGRVTVLTLTTKGRRLRERALGVPEALVRRMLGGRKPDATTGEHIATLRAQLKNLVTSLDVAARVPETQRSSV